MKKSVPDVGICSYCNKEVNINDFDCFYTKTRRKTIIYFHGECYRRYNALGFIIDEEEKK